MKEKIKKYRNFSRRTTTRSTTNIRGGNLSSFEEERSGLTDGDLTRKGHRDPDHPCEVEFIVEKVLRGEEENF